MHTHLILIKNFIVILFILLLYYYFILLYHIELLQKLYDM